MVSGEERWPSASDEFDVFLCHNSADKAEVQRVAERLRELGLKPWLDSEQLRPGFPAARGLQEQVGNVKAAAVFIGASGIGPWQEVEIYAFLGELVERGCPVIPLLLPGCPERPPLPAFIRMNTCIDLRDDSSDAIDRLYWGITGKRPDQTIVGETRRRYVEMQYQMRNKSEVAVFIREMVKVILDLNAAKKKTLLADSSQLDRGALDSGAAKTQWLRQ